MENQILPQSVAVANNLYAGLKVSMLVADQSACGHYRCINPAWYLRKYGAEVKCFNTASSHDLLWSDIIVAQRQYDPAIANTLIKDMLSLGKLVVYEIDDDLHNVNPSSPVFGIYHTGSPAIKVVSKLLQSCTGITVSTHELAGFYSGFNSNVELLPNSIDFDMRDWEYCPEGKDPNFLYVGWSGGITHAEDVQILGSVIPSILKKYDHVKFAIYTSEQLALRMVESWDLPLERVQLVPPVQFSEYPKYLGWFDIGLAPITNDRFNASKSALRYLELGARKVPGVFSVSAPYSNIIKNGVNGFTARTPNQWYEKLAWLIDHEAERKAMGELCYQTVKSDYDMDVNVHLWPKAWTNIKEVALELRKPKIWPSYYGKVNRNDPCPCGCGKRYKSCERYGAWSN